MLRGSQTPSAPQGKFLEGSSIGDLGVSHVIGRRVWGRVKAQVGRQRLAPHGVTGSGPDPADPVRSQLRGRPQPGRDSRPRSPFPAQSSALGPGEQQCRKSVLLPPGLLSKHIFCLHGNGWSLLLPPRPPLPVLGRKLCSHPSDLLVSALLCWSLTQAAVA